MADPTPTPPANLPSEERCDYCHRPIRPDDVHAEVTMIGEGEDRRPGVRCRIAQADHTSRMDITTRVS